MKKINNLIASLLVLTASLNGCSEPVPKVEECINHIDINDDGKCDQCGEDMPNIVKKFTGITLESETFDYDGKFHYILPKGVPEFAKVNYENNFKTEMGTYKVKATITAENYETLILEADLIIKGRTFTGITFEGQEFLYDREAHSIHVDGLPSYATVTYQNNNQDKPGEYIVTATITATNFETLVLEAKMTITNVLPKAMIYESTLVYTGAYQHIVFNIGKVPEYTSPVFEVDGQIVDEQNFTVKTVGEHIVSITLTNSTLGYEPSTVTAIINVVEDVGGVDPTKEPLKINEELKYQTLLSKILEGNFSYKYEYYSYSTNSEGELETIFDGGMVYYVNGDEIFEHSLSWLYQSYGGTHSYISHIKKCGDIVKTAIFSDGILDLYAPEFSYLMDASYYYETFVARYGTEAIVDLVESPNGGFAVKNSSNERRISFEFDSENNAFNVYVDKYQLNKDSNYILKERTKYTIYNIGNTTIDVPKALDATYADISDFVKKIYVNGCGIWVYKDSAYIDTLFDSQSLIYLPKGTYTIPALVDGRPVDEIYNAYSQGIDSLVGYTYRVYFDHDGYYQGEYESLGQVKGLSYLEQLTDLGATVLYYGEW